MKTKEDKTIELLKKANSKLELIRLAHKNNLNDEDLKNYASVTFKGIRNELKN